MKIRLRLFSIAKDLAGTGEMDVELDHESSASAVLDLLVKRDTRFREWMPSLRLAVNQEYVPGDHLLRDGDEVAVIPPVSGG